MKQMEYVGLKDELVEFEESFGKIKILEVRMKASGCVKVIKTDGNRRALLLVGDERWFSLFKDSKGFDGANEIVRKIDEDLTKGAFVDLEVVQSNKGFWNIRGLDIIVDNNEGVGEEPEEELFEDKPKKENPKKDNPDTTYDSRQAMIVSQSSSKDAIATVAQYDLSGAPEDVDAHIDRVWKKYFERTMKLA